MVGTLFTIVVTRLSQHRLRTLLTAAGVAVGAGSMIFLANMTHGFSAAAEERLGRLGGSLLMVVPQRTGETPALALSMDDADALSREIREVSAVVPMMQLRATVQACGVSRTATVVAAGPMLHRMGHHVAMAGRLISPIDDERNRAVAVLSRDLNAVLRCVEPHKTTVYVQGNPVHVIGLLESNGTLSDLARESIFVPTRVLYERFGNRLDGGFSLWITLKDGTQQQTAIEKVATILRRRHRVDSTTEPGIAIKNNVEITAEVRHVESNVRTALVAVMFWSFLISGVGIANSVFSSVLERTPCIGIQRAVGAKQRHIRLEFLIEAACVSLLGALLGIAAGVTCGAVAAAWVNIPIRVDPSAVSVASLSAFFLGIVAGWWPAMRAARVAPAEAIRAE